MQSLLSTSAFIEERIHETGIEKSNQKGEDYRSLGARSEQGEERRMSIDSCMLPAAISSGFQAKQWAGQVFQGRDTTKVLKSCWNWLHVLLVVVQPKKT